VPQTISGTLAGASQQFSHPCILTTRVDEAYLFTAPADGDYRFHVTNVQFGTEVYVLDGVCEGAPLECSRTMPPAADGYPSEVIQTMTAGQTVTIVVEAMESGGPFDLEISSI
jgi:hypothetical protein